MSDPQTIIATARAGRRVIGWRPAPSDRAHLLECFEPRYERAVADHVTLSARVASGTDLPDPVTAEVVGHGDDDRGVEALVVAIGGSTDRPGGGTYHMTWSLQGGRTAKESNDVLRELGWTPLERPLLISLIPAWLR